MKRFNFTDPFSSLPKLERQIVMLRCLEATLCLYYAEELKTQVIDMVSTTDCIRERREPSRTPRVRKGQRNARENALSAMVDDGAITDAERQKIKELIDFRNDIGHRIDQLFSDLEQARFTVTDFDAELRKIRRISEFDHKAVVEFELAFRVLDRAARSHFNAGTFHYGGHLHFSSSEKVILQKIRAIRKRLPGLVRERNKDIQRMNSDLPEAFKIMERHGHSQFNLRFPTGRMTQRGVEICFRLFDANICDLVIAQLFEMKLPSIRARHNTWLEMGGKKRPRVDFESLPNTIVPSEIDG